MGKGAGFLRRHAADIALGALALALGAAMLVGYGRAGDGALRVLLWPHAKATEVFYHISLYYQSGVGYVAAAGGFAIGPACMGMNFIVMLFGLMVCAFTRRFRGIRKSAFFVLALAGSVVAGVIVSCVRIIGSVPFLSFGHFATIHTGVGIALYLAVLAGSYILVNKATGGLHEKHR
jgi:exosortase K